jgi:hypothetical protein
MRQLYELTSQHELRTASWEMSQFTGKNTAIGMKVRRTGFAFSNSALRCRTASGDELPTFLGH